MMIRPVRPIAPIMSELPPFHSACRAMPGQVATRNATSAGIVPHLRTTSPMITPVSDV